MAMLKLRLILINILKQKAAFLNPVKARLGAAVLILYWFFCSFKDEWQNNLPTLLQELPRDITYFLKEIFRPLELLL